MVGMTFIIDSSPGCQPMLGCKSNRRDASLVNGMQSSQKDAVESEACNLVVGMIFIIDPPPGCEPMAGCRPE